MFRCGRSVWQEPFQTFQYIKMNKTNNVIHKCLFANLTNLSVSFWIGCHILHPHNQFVSLGLQISKVVNVEHA